MNRSTKMLVGLAAVLIAAALASATLTSKLGIEQVILEDGSNDLKRIGAIGPARSSSSSRIKQTETLVSTHKLNQLALAQINSLMASPTGEVPQYNSLPAIWADASGELYGSMPVGRRRLDEQDNAALASTGQVRGNRFVMPTPDHGISSFKISERSGDLIPGKRADGEQPINVSLTRAQFEQLMLGSENRLHNHRNSMNSRLGSRQMGDRRSLAPTVSHQNRPQQLSNSRASHPVKSPRTSDRRSMRPSIGVSKRQDRPAMKKVQSESATESDDEADSDADEDNDADADSTGEAEDEGGRDYGVGGGLRGQNRRSASAVDSDEEDNIMREDGRPFARGSRKLNQSAATFNGRRSRQTSAAGRRSDPQEERSSASVATANQVMQSSVGPDLQVAAGNHHHDHHGHYYQYVEVPKKKSWKFGFKRGNHKHTIERHEKGHKNKFHSSFKWHAKEKCKKKQKCESKGKMTWHYEHHDKKHHG